MTRYCNFSDFKTTLSVLLILILRLADECRKVWNWNYYSISFFKKNLCPLLKILRFTQFIAWHLISFHLYLNKIHGRIHSHSLGQGMFIIDAKAEYLNRSISLTAICSHLGQRNASWGWSEEIITSIFHWPQTHGAAQKQQTFRGSQTHSQNSLIVQNF